MKYHGNYCGPGWSGGKAQDSVISSVPATDEFDESCKEHDKQYYLKRVGLDVSLKEADKKFARINLASGNPKRMLAGALVGAQALLRSDDKTPIIKRRKRRNMVSQMEKYMKSDFYKMSHPTSKKSPAMRAAPKPSIPKKRGVQDTKVALPASYTLNANLGKPKITNGKDVTVLTHRGLMMTLTGSTTYGVTTKHVNPGKADVFPWAARLARSYDKYRFRRLKFIYRPVCATTQVGVVMLSFDYDTLDTVPATKAEQAQTFPNIESNAFAPCELKVECDNTWRFTRQGAISNADLKTYDIGQIVVSSAYATAALLGEIYVEYEVELCKPTHGTPLLVRVQTSSSTKTALFTSTSSDGTAQPWSVASTMTLLCNTPGEYSLCVEHTGTGIGGGNAPTITATVGSVVNTICAQIINGAQTKMVTIYSIRAFAGDVLTFPTPTCTTISGIWLEFTEGEVAYM